MSPIHPPLGCRTRTAEAYPFDVDTEPFIWSGGEILAWDKDCTRARTPLLAIGSNAAPARLAAKLKGSADTVVGAAPALLYDHAVVYAGHVTAYGSIPATLAPCAGAVALVAVIWVDDDALARIAASEGLGRNYRLRPLAGRIRCDAVADLGGIQAFSSLSGSLCLGGRPLRLAEIPTVRSTFQAMTQPALLRLVHRRLGAGECFDAFVDAVISAPAYRQEIRERLSAGL